MELKPLPLLSPLGAYEDQAKMLLAAHKAADPEAIRLFHQRHPRFLDDKIRWKPKSIPASEIREAALTQDDARLAIARFHDFLDWDALAVLVDTISRKGPVHDFATAVDAVIEGDLPLLQEWLRRDPALVRARSSRSCCFDPPMHR